MDIRLNFLPLQRSEFLYTIYRRKRGQDDLKAQDDYLAYLAEDNKEERVGYWISFIPRDDFESYDISSYSAIELTNHYMIWLMMSHLQTNGSPYPWAYKRGFAAEQIRFEVEKTPYGWKTFILYPYYLPVAKSFGFLVDYKFSKDPEVPFDKEVQRLSLSLDRNYRSNKSFYTEKFAMIHHFLRTMPVLFTAINTELQVINELKQVPGYPLNKKEYLFNSNKTSYSQFQGVRNFGPYEKLNGEALFVFLFEEKHKAFANEIYLSLVGKTNPGTFPGMEQMFKVLLGLHNVMQIKLIDTSIQTLSSAIGQLKNIKQSNTDKKIIGIFLESYAENIDTDASDSYYFLKYGCMKDDIPLQVINYRKIGERNALKWSTSNIGLQIFAKLGGKPWIVKPSNNNCLILGIGSSHKYDEQTEKIIKYLAYTVCLDSSGLYKSLEILADEQHQQNYLDKLRINLTALLRSGKFDEYRSCVLHLPFKIKRQEIEAIRSAIAEITNIEFTAIKINLDNKFFGFSDHNTLVPYESTCVQLSNHEYLVWFEGLQYGKEIVDKRLSNPIHLQFLRLHTNRDADSKYLQDVLNLSGANWRGFNAKSIPISIYYSKIITQYIQSFEHLEDFDDNLLKTQKPWFL